MIGTVSGHSDTWNDNTIMLHDELTRGMYDGKLFNDYKFTLFEHDKAGEVVEKNVRVHGSW